MREMSSTAVHKFFVEHSEICDNRPLVITATNYASDIFKTWAFLAQIDQPPQMALACQKNWTVSRREI
jgi:hypothetical protein